MKAPYLKKHDGIEQKMDDEIDTSDIPPLDDAFFSSAKWRLPPLYIYLNDFREARKFASYILNEDLHAIKKTARARERQRLEHLAFNTSLIISYSRPFKASYNFKGQPKFSLQNSLGEVLNQEELELHNYVIQMRDTAYARSDASTHLIEGFDYDKHVALMLVILPLDKSSTERLHGMIQKWIEFLEAQKSKLKQANMREHVRDLRSLRSA